MADKPNQANKGKAAKPGQSAKIVPLKRPFPPERQPDHLNEADAVRLVRIIAADSNNVIVTIHAVKQGKKRSITRIQIERCVRSGVLTEGPFINQHGNWQLNLTRQAAGEQITCAVAIEWATKVIVITTY